MSNSSYFVHVYVQSSSSNASKVALTKDVNRWAIFTRYLVIAYILEIEDIYLYI
jgi:hypothetical protein